VDRDRTKVNNTSAPHALLLNIGGIRSAYHHQPATALACHRHAGAACDTNNDHRGEFTRKGGSGREGVSRCRHFSKRTRKKKAAQLKACNAGGSPRESLPSLPSAPSIALAAAPRARLTQLSVEKTQKSGAHPPPTARFKLIEVSGSGSLKEPFRGAWRNYDMES
jgi:hypothetical protein